jgi:signal transduction histidine kinase
MRLSRKLPLLIVVAAVLPVLVGGGVAILIGRTVLRTEVLAAQAVATELYASAIEYYVMNARAVLETTARFPLLRRLAVDRDVAGAVLRSSAVFEYLMLLKADGTVQVLEPESLERQLSHRDLAFQAWYQDLIVSSQTVVSNLHISPATQRPTVVIAAPVRSEGNELIGIWAGALKLDALSRLGRTRSILGSPGGSGYVTDRRGLIIAHQTNPRYVENQTDFSAAPTVRAALNGQHGAFQFFNPIERVEKLGAYQPIPSLGWAVTYGVPVTAAFAPVGGMTWGIAVTAAALAVVMGGIGLVMARRIVRPLEDLTMGAKTIGAGDFSRPIEVRTGDELEQLAHEFNQMAASLAEKETQLQRRAAELEAANRELEAFSYSVSHDLRAPLRAMDGFSRMLLEKHGAELPAEGRRLLQVVRDNARQMGELVDDLLAFSRLGRQSLAVSRVEPAEIVRQAWEALRPQRDGRRIELAVGDLPACRADPTLLRQVFVNLLENALKFTRRRDVAHIEVSCQTIKGEAAYVVRDDGVGFDMAYAHKLFGVFQRLHRTEDYEGTGVGLAIVQRIVHRHGGRVWADAVPDGGATFFFTLGEGGADDEPHDRDPAGRRQPA